MNIRIMKLTARSMKVLFAIASIGVTGYSNAETLTFSSFTLEVGEGWVHTVETTPRGGSGPGERVSFYHPSVAGVLKIQSLQAPAVVTRDVLRNMTNVDSSVPLSWQDWGEFSGYQYDYAEGTSYFRQWWLVNQRRLVFVVYESSSEPANTEVNEIVNSLTPAGP